MLCRMLRQGIIRPKISIVPQMRNSYFGLVCFGFLNQNPHKFFFFFFFTFPVIDSMPGISERKERGHQNLHCSGSFPLKKVFTKLLEKSEKQAQACVDRNPLTSVTKIWM